MESSLRNGSSTCSSEAHSSGTLPTPNSTYPIPSTSSTNSDLPGPIFLTPPPDPLLAASAFLTQPSANAPSSSTISSSSDISILLEALIHPSTDNLALHYFSDDILDQALILLTKKRRVLNEEYTSSTAQIKGDAAKRLWSVQEFNEYCRNMQDRKWIHVAKLAPIEKKEKDILNAKPANTSTEPQKRARKARKTVPVLSTPPSNAQVPQCGPTEGLPTFSSYVCATNTQIDVRNRQIHTGPLSVHQKYPPVSISSSTMPPTAEVIEQQALHPDDPSPLPSKCSLLDTIPE